MGAPDVAGAAALAQGHEAVVWLVAEAFGGVCVALDRGGVGERGAVKGRPASAPLTSRPFCRLPLPAGCDRARSALVPALWPSYRDVEELLAERGVGVDHVTVYRHMQCS